MNILPFNLRPLVVGWQRIFLVDISDWCFCRVGGREEGSRKCYISNWIQTGLNVNLLLMHLSSLKLSAFYLELGDPLPEVN